MPLDRHHQEQLERLVDGGSLRAVLESLSEICVEKSLHVEEAWQDRTLARRWMRAAKIVDRCATSAGVDDVS